MQMYPLAWALSLASLGKSFDLIWAKLQTNQWYNDETTNQTKQQLEQNALLPSNLYQKKQE